MRILITTILAASICVASQGGVDTRRYDDIFANLQGERQGVSKDEINKLQSPFRLSVVESDTAAVIDEAGPKPIALILNGVIQNRARINGSWYTVGSEISDYKITRIDNAGVTLVRTKDKQQLKLTNGSKNVNIQIR